MKLTKNIYKADSSDEQGNRDSVIQKKTQELLDSIGVDLLRKNLRFSVIIQVSEKLPRLLMLLGVMNSGCNQAIFQQTSLNKN